MATSPKTEILTVRIAPRLLNAVKERARRAGRSVSSEVVMLLEAEVDARKPRRAIAPISGWLSDETVPTEVEGFRKARRRTSAELTSAVRAKGRRA
jgi:hypothetical protein